MNGNGWGKRPAAGFEPAGRFLLVVMRYPPNTNHDSTP